MRSFISWPGLPRYAGSNRFLRIDWLMALNNLKNFYLTPETIHSSSFGSGEGGYAVMGDRAIACTRRTSAAIEKSAPRLNIGSAHARMHNPEETYQKIFRQRARIFVKCC